MKRAISLVLTIKVLYFQLFNLSQVGANTNCHFEELCATDEVDSNSQKSEIGLMTAAKHATSDPLGSLLVDIRSEPRKNQRSLLQSFIGRAYIDEFTTSRLIRRDFGQPILHSMPISPSVPLMSPSIVSSASLHPTSLHPTSLHPTATSSATPWPTPTPFDVGFSHNITEHCHNFMTRMLGSLAFKQCSPLSMVLQNSNSFFHTAKNLLRITSLLDSSCSAPVSSCTELLDAYARNLTSSTACADDLARINPQIQSALLGLKSYRTLYTASCLRTLPNEPSADVNEPSTDTNKTSTPTQVSNPSTKVADSSYCFANAITNTSNPTDSYVYFLPLNVSLVGSAVPTCNSCLQSTMSVFHQATANRSDVLVGTYAKAASQINVVCGPQFVNSSIAAAFSSASLTVSSNKMMAIFSFIWLFFFLASWPV